MTSPERVLCWFRRDLRADDQTAFSVATHDCREVIGLFLFDTQILDKLPPNDRRVSFIYESVQDLRKVFQQQGSDLLIRYGKPETEIPQLAQQLKVNAVYCNHDYEPYAIARDRKVKRELARRTIAFYTFKDQVIFEKQEILNRQGEPFRVFTPYSRAWRQAIRPQHLSIRSVRLRNLAPRKLLSRYQQNPTLQQIGLTTQTLWLPTGTAGAKKSWQQFKKNLGRYQQDRDFPAREGTSALSVHLRFGTLSLRELVRAVIKIKSAGAQTWLNELIWREFYQMILSNFPHVVRGAFQQKYNAIKWPGNRNHFRAWCEGQTGYPIIDAAMRLFNQTGWMHNRLRMIVATFLCKDLLINWRWGEKYFAENVLDFDLAGNNGGWQWCASTGIDAQLYFRIFNPITQSKKFDPEGTFIKQYCPELAQVPLKYLHQPARMRDIEQKRYGCRLGKEYPKALVDHTVQRERAIDLYKRIM